MGCAEEKRRRDTPLKANERPVLEDESGGAEQSEVSRKGESSERSSHESGRNKGDEEEDDDIPDAGAIEQESDDSEGFSDVETDPNKVVSAVCPHFQLAQPSQQRDARVSVCVRVSVWAVEQDSLKWLRPSALSPVHDDFSLSLKRSDKRGVPESTELATF